ncbi:hypothetical protein SAMN02799624_05288 [Paenibacillus sp. UNC496MF]|uniref:hypothetical protein n=1 Tax=Paenibacillus sp. UNC496MF TaxID=1502753 RepID=UPI0008E931F2|nr:hypothetical protein [Paenibacillus sp. UNC496MF]SFJ63556.1 hypothetical protein SAMN02799624_05288 [Paenibacillus sp. UNC496MF]
MSQAVKPADALGRFMFGIFNHYRDNGLSIPMAKGRMFDEALQTCAKMIKDETDIPDHGLVIAAQMVSQLLNHRGYELSQAVEKSQDPNDPRLEPMRQIKAAKDAIDLFISTYKGEQQHG